MKTYKLYILMRTDLPSMNPGKAMAQGAHAANLFSHRWSKSPRYKAWAKEGNGFGTTITLAVNKQQLEDIVARAAKKGEWAGVVMDSTYPYIVSPEIAGLINKKHHSDDPVELENGKMLLFRNEVTCGFLFVEDGSPSQAELVGELPLHP